MAGSRKEIGKPSGGRKTVRVVAKEPRDVPPSPPIKKVLGEIPVTTELYTAADVDALIAEGKLIEDEDIPGDFYTISIKSGRLIVRQVAHAE